MHLTANDIQELLEAPIYKIRSAIRPSVRRIQEEFSSLIVHAANRARSLDKSARTRGQTPRQVEDMIQLRFASAMRTFFRSLGGDIDASEGVPIDQFANNILQIGFRWACFNLDEAWILGTKMDGDLDSRISWDDFSGYVNKILEGIEVGDKQPKYSDDEFMSGAHSDEAEEARVFAELRVLADQARAEGKSVLTRLDQLAIDESNGSTLSKPAVQQLLDYLAADVSPDVWVDVQQPQAGSDVLESGEDFDECLRELSWTRVLIQERLLAFDDKFAKAKQQLQEFEEKKNRLDDVKDSGLSVSIPLSALGTFLEQESPTRTLKSRPKSPTRLRRTKSSPDLRLRQYPSTPQGFIRSSISPVSRRRDDVSYGSEHFTLSSRASNVIRTPLSRKSAAKNIFDEDSARWRSARRATPEVPFTESQDLALGQRVIQMLYC